MSSDSRVWLRPDMALPRMLDAIFFDVDGVLIRTIHSFRAATLAAVAYICRTIHGLDWELQEDGAQPFVSYSDIDEFKLAGGFNGDWDMCYLLAALATARLREWHSTDLARRSTREWASLARAATLEGRGGRAWVEATFPASALTDYDQIVDLFNEYYWGRDELGKRFGREPLFVPDAPGYVHNEEMLFQPAFFSRLRAAGVPHFGMITGRIGPEVDSAQEHLETYTGSRWWDVLIPADLYAKPDPRALRTALSVVSAHTAIYVGDTADDFDLVRRYKAEKSPQEPDVLVAMVVRPSEAELYQQRGADLLLESVEDLLDLFPTVIVSKE